MNDFYSIFRPVNAPIPTSGGGNAIVSAIKLPATEAAFYQVLKSEKSMGDHELVGTLAKLALGVLITSDCLTSKEPIDVIFRDTITNVSLEKARVKELIRAHEKVLVDARALYVLAQKILPNGGAHE